MPCGSILSVQPANWDHKPEYQEMEDIPAGDNNGLYTSISFILRHEDKKYKASAPWNKFITTRLIRYQKASVEKVLPNISSIHRKNPNSLEGRSPPQSKIIEDKSLVVSYLRIICACSEIFPRGDDCWSSSNKFWYGTTYSPLDSYDDSERIHPVRTYCNICSLTDLTFTIESFSTLLEQFGGAGGDPGIQMWTLICLLKVSEPLIYLTSVEE